MPLEKGLILKGVAGVAALAGGGVGVAYGTGAFSSRRNEVNKKLTSLGLVDCVFTDNEVVGETFSKECELDQDKFKKINFSNKDGNNNVSVTGWSSNITLKIENKEGDNKGIKFTFKNPPSDLTVTGGDNQDNKFSIKANKETEFEEKEGKLSKKVNADLSSKLKGYNKKLGNLSIPDSCKFDVTEEDTSIECEVSDAELKKIKFSNKGEGELSLVGLSSSQKIKLIIERDTTSQPEALKYKFKNETSSNITLTGEQKKIVLKGNKEREFKEESERLVKRSVDSSLSEKLKGYNTTLKTLSLPEGCRFDETEDDTSFECDISQENIKKINFSNRGTEDLKINNWGSNGNIKLKVEHSSTPTEEINFSFKELKSDVTIYGEKTKGKIVLKTSNGNKKFKVEGGKLTKVSSDNTNKDKFQEFNKQLGDLDVPVECRFDEAENDSTVTCQITKEQLKKIKFWNKQEGQDLTIEEEEGFTTANLEVKKDNKSNLKLVFKDLAKTVKVKGNENNSFNLRQNTNGSDEFEIRDNVLGQVRKLGKNKTIAGLTCNYSGNGNSGKCKATKGTVNVIQSSTTETGGTVTITDTNADIFDFSEYEDGYNLTTKFTYIGDDTTASTNGLQLEKNTDYNTVNKSNDQIYLTKKSK